MSTPPTLQATQGLTHTPFPHTHTTLSTLHLLPPLSHRWHSQHCVLNLLQLGREGFTPQLQAYLADTPELLWMSQVQSRQYSAATDSLVHAAADTATAADARRLWCLTKLAVKASGPKAKAGSAGRMATASARLKQLQLQAALLPGSDGAAAPMQTEELATAALKAASAPAGGADQRAMGAFVGGLRGAEAAVAAVEVLALDTASLRNQGQSRRWVGGLDVCWCVEARGLTGREVWQ